MPSMKQIRAMPQWVARSGASTLTVRAVDITQARERCAKIGMREPSSIVIKTDPSGDARAAVKAFERWHCAACGLFAIHAIAPSWAIDHG